MTILRVFRVMLFTGFIGGAYWSRLQSPIPYPLPFGVVFQPDCTTTVFTIIQTHLQAKGFTHEHFARKLHQFGLSV